MKKGKEKAYYLHLVNNIKPTFQIGKEGISKNLITDLLNYLNKHEIMKVSILNNCLEDLEYILQVLNNNGIEVITKIGHNLVLFKENKKIKNSIAYKISNR